MRWFFDTTPHVLAQEVTLKGEEAKHICKVLRLQTGDNIIITDGCGTEAVAALTFVSPKLVSYKVQEVNQRSLHNLPVSVLISPTKQMQRLEYAIEKITEIGVRQIYLYLTENTERKHVNMDRLQKKIQAAIKQSRQAWMPQLEIVTSIDQLAVDYTHKYVAYAEEHSNLDIKELKHNADQQILVAIGPEGDFTPSELQQMKDLDFKQIVLGPNRLRTETAIVYAVVALQSTF